MKINLQTASHRAFQVGVFLKGFDGVLDIVGGAALLLTTQPAIQRAVAFLTHEELIEDPHDFLANLLVRVAQHLSIHTQHFAGLYLLGHGIVKVGLAIGLLRGLLWSYPAALLFLTAFVFYQVYRVIHTFSITLSVLTAFDVAIALLILREWQHAKNRYA